MTRFEEAPVLGCGGQSILLCRETVKVSIGIEDECRADDVAYAIVDAMLGLSFAKGAIVRAMEQALADLG